MKTKQMGRILSIVILLTGFLYANQVSLECTKVKRGSCEALICNSNELMNLDTELAIAYNEAIVMTSNVDVLKTHQRYWAKNRNECWKVQDVNSYLIDIYHIRIKELKDQYPVLNT